LSFFDDDEETAQRPASRAPRAPQRPSPRRPQRAGGSLPLDQHTLMVRRRVAFGVGIVLLIIIILLINGCLKGQKTDALKSYNHEVSLLAQEFDEHVSRPLFSALSGAGGKSALNVEVQVDQLRVQAQDLAARVKKLSTPSEMSGAQDNLLLAFDLRTEAVTKVAALTPTALGGQGKQATAQIAGDMEIFLASDVLYSQRVAPLIQQALKEGGAEGLTTAPSRSLPNLGWLEPTTIEERITGKSGGTTNSETTSGTHGSALTGVSVGANTLATEPTLNHVSGGSNPTFTVNVENGGESAETNVKVNVVVTAGGKQFKASHAIEKAEPGKTVSVDIPVNGVPLGEAAKVEINVEKVAGETNTENNKGTYLAVFAN
jgi:outer membrane murein-binding lipoprotein Lpp